MNMQITRWKDVDWVLAKSTVFKWQREIFEASKAGDIRLVRKCQHKVIESTAAKLLAVKRVTQDNRGKKTAGVDGVNSVPPEQRLALAKSLVISGKASPLRRVWIPKPGRLEKRPLGIPTIYDRCLQALFKMALEPEWEAKFENNSYGFRPGRNCHDAIASVRLFIQKRSKYVLDADISKCFDRIDHTKLLNKIGMTGKYRRQLQSWLKSGVMDGDIFSETRFGTPQGGVISPLLANIALSGMDDFIKNLIKDIPMRGSTGQLVKPSRRKDTIGVVRYADDFLVIHPDLAVIELVHEKLPEFLAQIGLELSPHKTRITNTLNIAEETKERCPGLNGKPGFVFLGFYIRQYATKHLSAYGRNGKPLGYRTIIIPSKEKQKEHLRKLHKVILMDGKGLNQDALICKLNPVIRGWSNYFGKSDANSMKILGKMDYYLYLMQRKWSKRVYKTTGKGQAAFRTTKGVKWKFATDKSVAVKHAMYSLPLSSYNKVKGDASPFDHNQVYWAKRLTTNNTFNRRVTVLLKAQRGKCKWCKTLFFSDDIMEVDHIVPIASGGKDVYKNMQLLHGHCHDTKTSLDNISSRSIISPQ